MLAATTDLLDAHADALMALGSVLDATGDAAGAPAAVEEALALYERKGNLVSAAAARRSLDTLTAA
jgi:hypothetical protein